MAEAANLARVTSQWRHWGLIVLRRELNAAGLNGTDGDMKVLAERVTLLELLRADSLSEIVAVKRELAVFFGVLVVACVRGQRQGRGSEPFVSMGQVASYCV